LLSANVWLSDISTFHQMNAVWDEWVTLGMPPARACVESRLAGPEFKVEIMVVGARWAAPPGDCRTELMEATKIQERPSLIPLANVGHFYRTAAGGERSRRIPGRVRP
jgi:hypothetical protein